jgi:aminoglycoside phosphotransferase (APT) family kinase protein
MPEIIFKEGKLEKLMEEKKCLDRWQKIVPGLTPRVYGFEKHGDFAVILIEFLEGMNFQEIVLGQDDELLAKALSKVVETLDHVWNITKKEQRSNAKFVKQLNDRIPDVYRVHPEFKACSKSIGDHVFSSLHDLLEKASGLDKKLQSPFSVMIHGDFNSDNIIYNDEMKKLFFIDVHRSKYMDYIQDISVFMVSNFRLPFLNNPIRGRINDVIMTFYEFCKKFADKHDDRTFQARLALGLVRSFITSTRFELNKEFAEIMYLRGIYLMDKLVKCLENGKDFENFKLDKDVLIY